MLHLCVAMSWSSANKEIILNVSADSHALPEGSIQGWQLVAAECSGVSCINRARAMSRNLSEASMAQH